jgi:hypothetical protein
VGCETQSIELRSLGGPRYSVIAANGNFPGNRTAYANKDFDADPDDRLM